MEKIVIGNLKMNILTPVDRKRYLEFFRKELAARRFRNTEIVLCPACIHLEDFKKNLNGRIEIGAQNMFWKKEGAFTGEISGTMFKNFGAEYVIIGHSERRKYFCETDEEINLKVAEALKIGLGPVICVGETKVEKDSYETLSVISRQVKEALSGISRTKAENIIIAYEPVWAVGTDETPTANEIMEARVLIQKILVEIFSKKYAQKVKVIYGGSVNHKTTRELCVDPGMDGALVGRESLTPREFLKIVEVING